MTFPEPACVLGYTENQLDDVLNSYAAGYQAWAAGKTRGMCLGNAGCDVAHGDIHYEDDVRRYWRQIVNEDPFGPPNAR